MEARNNRNDNTEELLNSLRPARPSDDLRRRIAQEVDSASEKRRQRLAYLWLAPITAAAAMAIVLCFPVRREPAIPAMPTINRTARRPAVIPPAVFQPVQFKTVLVDGRDEGTCLLADRTPARRLRYRFVDTFEWKDDASGSVVSRATPRDEIVLLAMDTY